MIEHDITDDTNPRPVFQDPEFGIPSFDLDDFWTNQGAWDDIITALCTAIWLDATSSSQHQLLGEILLNHGDRSAAETEFRRAIRIMRDRETALQDQEKRLYATLYMHLAKSLSSERGHAEAIDSIREAIRI